jgi:hypothetical protein
MSKKDTFLNIYIRTTKESKFCFTFHKTYLFRFFINMGHYKIFDARPPCITLLKIHINIEVGALV